MLTLGACLLCTVIGTSTGSGLIHVSATAVCAAVLTTPASIAVRREGTWGAAGTSSASPDVMFLSLLYADFGHSCGSEELLRLKGRSLLSLACIVRFLVQEANQAVDSNSPTFPRLCVPRCALSD